MTPLKRSDLDLLICLQGASEIALRQGHDGFVRPSESGVSQDRSASTRIAWLSKNGYLEKRPHPSARRGMTAYKITTLGARAIAEGRCNSDHNVLGQRCQVTFGERLRDLRGRRQLTMVQVAAQIGCSPGYLSELENDRVTPGAGYLEALADFYGVTVDYLLGRVVTDDQSTVTALSMVARRLPEREVSLLLTMARELERGVVAHVG